MTSLYSYEAVEVICHEAIDIAVLPTVMKLGMQLTEIDTKLLRTHLSELKRCGRECTGVICVIEPTQP